MNREVTCMSPKVVQSVIHTISSPFSVVAQETEKKIQKGMELRRGTLNSFLLFIYYYLFIFFPSHRRHRKPNYVGEH